jgi:hypothetical protein
VAALAGVIVCVGASALVHWESSPRRTCGSHGFHGFLSADGKYRAVVYEYDCGATTPFGTNVAILPASQTFDVFEVPEGEQVFEADGDHGAVTPDSMGILPVIVRWQDAHTLRISVPRAARVFRSSRQSGPIRIEYAVVD